MRKRSISVPKTEKDMIDLDYDKATDYQLIEIVLIENEFIFFHHQGHIKEINKITGCLIDDFEDESICEINKLELVIHYLKSVQLYDSTGFLRVLSFLFSEAIKRKTGVFFFF